MALIGFDFFPVDFSVPEKYFPAQVADHLFIVGGKEKGCAKLPVEHFHCFENIEGVFSIEVCSGFVGKYYGGLFYHGTGNCHSLTFSARELRGPGLYLVSKSDPFNGIGNQFLSLCSSVIKKQEGKFDIFPDCMNSKKVIALEDESELSLSQAGCFFC